MTQLVRLGESDEELTAEAKVLVPEKLKRDARLKHIVWEMHQRKPWGEFGKWLEEIGIPRRTGDRWVTQITDQKARKQFGHMAKLENQLTIANPGNVQVLPAQLIQDPRPTAQQFRREVDKAKKENEALFENRAQFMINRINDALQKDAPGQGLPDLLRIDPADLSPSDFDLVLKMAEACRELSLRAHVWHMKLKEKFNVESR
jgi:hypothetical protein